MLVQVTKWSSRPLLVASKHLTSSRELLSFLVLVGIVLLTSSRELLTVVLVQLVYATTHPPPLTCCSPMLSP